jgi:TfoX/Sxy family transcriptional regulator of competence genes
MAYDQQLAQRIWEELRPLPNVVEKKMFGGVCFLVDGNMACGVIKNDLIVRVGAARHAQSLAQPHTRIFDFSGRPMNGWVMVAPGGCSSDQDLQTWVRQGVAFAKSLPPK